MKKEIKKLKFYWHIHHDVLVEPLTEPIKNRIEFIKENKPKDEVELRLKLMKPVKGKLPKELVEAGQKWDEEWQKWDEARQKYKEAWQKSCEARQKYKEAGQKYDLQIIALHKKECPNCPWDSKRQTIFSK
jgi:hypothetical protein